MLRNSAALAFGALLAAALAGCGPPARGAAAAGPTVLVANALDGTVSRIDAVSGRTIGTAARVAPSPLHVVPGPQGSFLVVSRASQLWQLTYAALRDGAWMAQPLALPAHSGEILIAGDGGRFAVAVFHQQVAAPDPLPCSAAVIDLVEGAIVRVFPLCGTRDSVYSLAVENAPSNATLYLGLWRESADSTDRRAARPGGPAGTGVIAAVDLPSGAVVARQAIAGVPEHLQIGAAPGGVDHRVYVISGTPGPTERNPGLVTHDPVDLRLLGLNSDTLEIESEITLQDEVIALSIADDGRTAYAVVAGPHVRRSAIARIDLATGAMHTLAVLPGESVGGIAVTGNRIFVPSTFGSDVWVLDRQHGRLLDTVHVGRRPVSLALAAR